RWLSRHRCAVQTAGRGNGPGEAAGLAAPDPAAHARTRDVRAHLALLLAERHRAAGGRTGPDADQPLSLGRAARGRALEEGVSGDGSQCEGGLRSQGEAVLAQVGGSKLNGLMSGITRVILRP